MASDAALSNYQIAKTFFEERRIKKHNYRRVYSSGIKHVNSIENLDEFIEKIYCELRDRPYLWKSTEYTCGCTDSSQNPLTIKVDAIHRGHWAYPIDKLHPYGSQEYSQQYEHRNRYYDWLKEQNDQFFDNELPYSVFSETLRQFVKPESLFVTSYRVPLYILNPDYTKTYLSYRWFWSWYELWSMGRASLSGLAFVRYSRMQHLIHAGSTGIPTKRRCRSCVGGMVPVECVPGLKTHCKHGSRVPHYDWSNLDTCLSCNGDSKVLQFTMSKWNGLPITFDTTGTLVGSFPQDNLSEVVPIPNYLAHRHWDSIYNFANINTKESESTQR